MKRLIGATALLALGACGSSSTQESKGSDVGKLELKLDQYQTKAISSHAMLTDQVIALKNTVNTQKNQIDILAVDVKRLQSEVDALKAAAASPGTAPTPTPTPTAPPTRVEESIVRIDKAILDLKKGTAPDQVIDNVKDVPDLAATRLSEALKANLTDPAMTTAIEAVLSKLPARSLTTAMAELLRDPLRRGSAGRVIGNVHDRDLSKLLEPFTADADDDFCYLVGSSLLTCRNKAGVPALLKVLRATHKETRFLAITALKSLTRSPLGYDFNLNAEQNSQAIKAWGEWWDTNKAKLFE